MKLVFCLDHQSKAGVYYVARSCCVRQFLKLLYHGIAG